MFYWNNFYHLITSVPLLNFNNYNNINTFVSSFSFLTEFSSIFILFTSFFRFFFILLPNTYFLGFLKSSSQPYKYFYLYLQILLYSYQMHSSLFFFIFYKLDFLGFLKSSLTVASNPPQLTETKVSPPLSVSLQKSIFSLVIFMFYLNFINYLFISALILYYQSLKWHGTRSISNFLNNWFWEKMGFSCRFISNKFVTSPNVVVTPVQP